MEFHDPIESCPFNIMHRIRRSRMQFHVTTCAQNHPNQRGLEQCPFDARHLVKRIEFEHHKSTCPARASVIEYAIHDKSAQNKLRLLPFLDKPAGRWIEKWDDDPDVKTYDPIQNIKNKPIVYPLIGVSKSKRKNHRLEERMRYQRIMQNGGEDPWKNQFYSTSLSASSKMNRTVEIVHEIGNDTDEGKKPLRPPTNFLINGSMNKTFSRDSRLTTEPSLCKDPEISSTSSEVYESTNYLSSSAASLSSNQGLPFSNKSSEDCWMFEKISGTANVDKKAQEESFIPDADSIASSKNDYGFSQYKDQEELIPDSEITVSSKNNYLFNHYKNEEKIFIPYTESIVSSKDDYQFIPYQCKDQEKLFIPDTESIVSSKDDIPYQCNDQEKLCISDTESIVSSRDDYQFIPYQYKNQEKLCVPDTESIASSRDEYQFMPYQCKNQEKLSITENITSSKDDYEFYQYEDKDEEKYTTFDTMSVVSSNGKYQFYQHQHKDQEIFSNPDLDNIVHNENDHQLSVPLAHERADISLSPSIHDTSETDSVYTYIEDDLAYTYIEDDLAVKISTTIVEELAKNDKNHEELLISDTVYNVSIEDESHYIKSLMHGILDTSPVLSQVDENSSSSLSYKTAQSHNSSGNTSSVEEDSVLDELSKTIEEIAVNDECYKKKAESLKNLPLKNKSREVSATVNYVSKEKLFRRCAANFLNLKQ